MKTSMMPNLYLTLGEQLNLRLDSLINGTFTSHDAINIQDTTHIGTKLRNLLLKTSVLLPFGNKAISLSHLKLLMRKAPKDIHGLTISDISPDDRQNYKSLEKIMKTRVTEALNKYVVGSEATVAFLTMCKYITSAFLDRDLQPIERVYRIWYATYLLRIWRKFILDSDVYDLKNNFITSNAQACTEINAIGLIQLIVVLRDSGKSNMFIPHLFDSQPCESTFRQLRSLGTINWTRINFSLMECLQMIERTELENDIVFSKLSKTVKFPRNKMDQEKHVQGHFCLPTNIQIKESMERALHDATQKAKESGLNVEKYEILKCYLQQKRNNSQIFNVNTDNDEEIPMEMDEIPSEIQDPIYSSFMNRDENINLRSYKNVSVSENSKYLQICEEDGTIKNVLKSSIVWILSDPVAKLSKDRLSRVRAISSQQIHAKRSKLDPGQTRKETESLIHVGDWSIFFLDASLKHLLQNSLPSEVEYIENVLFGCVLGFEFSDVRLEKEKKFYADFTHIYEEQGEKRSDLNVMAAWNVVSNDGEIISIGTKSCFFINMKHFIAISNSPISVEMANKMVLKVKISDIEKIVSEQQII